MGSIIFENLQNLKEDNNEQFEKLKEFVKNNIFPDDDDDEDDDDEDDEDKEMFMIKFNHYYGRIINREEEAFKFTKDENKIDKQRAHYICKRNKRYYTRWVFNFFQ